MEEEDLWFIARDRRRSRSDFIMKAYWDLTAAEVARHVAKMVGEEVGREVVVDIYVDGGGRPTIVAGNTMVCRPIPTIRQPTNHRPTNPYSYGVRGE